MTQGDLRREWKRVKGPRLGWTGGAADSGPKTAVLACLARRIHVFKTRNFGSATHCPPPWYRATHGSLAFPTNPGDVGDTRDAVFLPRSREEEIAQAVNVANELGAHFFNRCERDQASFRSPTNGSCKV